MKEPTLTKRDIARELARRYSTMAHDELDILESILVPMKFARGEKVVESGDVSDAIYYVERGMVREFYFKNNKSVTEYLAADGTIVMSIESL
ncbi:MAG: Crp/Fnr family transcriptional regulator, partial [Prevotella pectinovora]